MAGGGSSDTKTSTAAPLWPTLQLWPTVIAEPRDPMAKQENRRRQLTTKQRPWAPFRAGLPPEREIDVGWARAARAILLERSVRLSWRASVGTRKHRAAAHQEPAELLVIPVGRRSLAR